MLSAVFVANKFSLSDDLQFCTASESLRCVIEFSVGDHGQWTITINAGSICRASSPPSLLSPLVSSSCLRRAGRSVGRSLARP